MSKQQVQPITQSTNSSGQSNTDEYQLDTHYRLARREYDACIAAVGIQKSWRVLDAGCGNGIFLPHLSTLVGKHGSAARPQKVHDLIGSFILLPHDLCGGY